MSEIRDEAFVVSCDPARLDVAMIHGFLSRESYWARGVPLATVQRSIGHSLCFAGLLGLRQVAFARAVTDRATFAYLADVFVLPECRGRGYAARVMQAVIEHPDLQGLRRFALVTADGHGLYRRYGFRPLAKPENFMERHDPEVYGRQA